MSLGSPFNFSTSPFKSPLAMARAYVRIASSERRVGGTVLDAPGAYHEDPSRDPWHKTALNNLCINSNGTANRLFRLHPTLPYGLCFGMAEHIVTHSLRWGEADEFLHHIECEAQYLDKSDEVVESIVDHWTGTLVVDIVTPRHCCRAANGRFKRLRLDEERFY
jgi:hypothetical protein